MIARATVVAGLVAVLGACGPKAPPNASGVTKDDAILLIDTNVPEANLFVDGHFVGPVGILKGGVAVEPGKHRLELRHEDYFSAYIELDAKRAERRELKISLAPVLP